jgi:hypothetical protein
MYSTTGAFVIVEQLLLFSSSLPPPLLPAPVVKKKGSLPRSIYTISILKKYDI